MKARLAVVFLFLSLLVAVPSVWAEEMVVDMHALTPEGIGEKIGTISISETYYGTLITPKLSWLSPGLHGFHVHDKGSCDAAGKDGKMGPGMAAGGHYDPDKTAATKGPMPMVTRVIYLPSMSIQPVRPCIRYSRQGLSRPS